MYLNGLYEAILMARSYGSSRATLVDSTCWKRASHSSAVVSRRMPAIAARSKIERPSGSSGDLGPSV